MRLNRIASISLNRLFYLLRQKFINPLDGLTIKKTDQQKVFGLIHTFEQICDRQRAY